MLTSSKTRSDNGLFDQLSTEYYSFWCLVGPLYAFCCQYTYKYI